MNAQRRKQIEKLNEEVRDILGRVEELKDEEQEYYDNMPESFQSGDKGQQAEQAVDTLDSAMQSLEEVASYLEESVA